MPTKEVVLPSSVANAKLTVCPRSTGRSPDLVRVQFYVDDEGLRRLGSVPATDGSAVDLSGFDGYECPGIRAPDYWDESKRRYLTTPTWEDHDMYRPPASTDPFNWDSYEKSEYKGCTPEGWSQHAYQMPLKDATTDQVSSAGVAPYVLLHLKDGLEVRGWLTPQGNAYP